MEIKTPDLGVDSAEVSEIMVSVGDVIAVDDNIVLLESDKASVEVPSTAAGKVTEILVAVGDQISEGAVLIKIEAADGEGSSDSAPAEDKPQAAQPASEEKAPAQEKPAAAPASGGGGGSTTHALPDLGVDEAEVSEVMVSVGDVVEAEQPLILVESDKASVEVPAPQAGTIEKILVSAGDTVSNGQDFIVISGGEGSSAASSGSESSAAPAPQAQAQSQDKPAAAPAAAGGEQTYALPDLGVDEAEVSEVLVSVGDEVSEEQSLLLVESDKASVEVPAPAAGKIVKLLVNAGDTVSNGQDFIVIATSGGAAAPADTGASAPAQSESKPAAPKPQAQPPAKSAQPASSGQKLSESQVNAKLTEVYAGPAVRKLARQLGVDVTQVKGSASNSRIIKEDLFAYVKTRLSAAPAAAAPAQAGGAQPSGLPALPDMSKKDIWGETETEALSRLQKVSIPQLNYNTYLPQVTQFDLSDITETEKLRGELKGDFKAQGIGLTILAFIVKATAYALMEHPKFNSHLSDDNSEIIIRKTVNMGFAVATDDGLVVPVIKDAQAKGIKQIAIEIGELAKKARDKKLGVKDMQGASFTISSQGNLGGTAFTPLVNWPFKWVSWVCLSRRCSLAGMRRLRALSHA